MKNNRVLFIVIGVILLCCCVVVIAVAAAYPTIKNYFNNSSSGLQNLNPATTSTPETAAPTTQPLPTSRPSSGGSSTVPVAGGLGDPTLKADVWNSILNAESRLGCSDVTSTTIVVIQQPDPDGVWIELWSANVCGNNMIFQVKFRPDGKGGTNYDINFQ